MPYREKPNFWGHGCWRISPRGSSSLSLWSKCSRIRHGWHLCACFERFHAIFFFCWTWITINESNRVKILNSFLELGEMKSMYFPDALHRGADLSSFALDFPGFKSPTHTSGSPSVTLSIKQNHKSLCGRGSFMCFPYKPFCPIFSPITISSIHFDKHL